MKSVARRWMLDADLARVYGVMTARLNQQVKHNHERFPGDFVFRLTSEEYQSLMLQIATSKARRGGRRKVPYAFTEHGAIMASMVLKRRPGSPDERICCSSVRAHARSARRAALRSLEKDLRERVDSHEAAIISILQRLMDIIDPPALPEPPKTEIGFHVKEACGKYTRRPH